MVVGYFDVDFDELRSYLYWTGKVFLILDSFLSNDLLIVSIMLWPNGGVSLVETTLVIQNPFLLIEFSLRNTSFSTSFQITGKRLFFPGLGTVII